MTNPLRTQRLRAAWDEIYQTAVDDGHSHERACEVATETVETALATEREEAWERRTGR
jgi:cation transport regulator ChaB